MKVTPPGLLLLPRRVRHTLAAVAWLALAGWLPAALGQDARTFVEAAVRSELQSDKTDHTAFLYKDHDVTPEQDTVIQVIETPQGLLRRKLLDHGKPLSPEARAADDRAIAALLNNAALRAKNQHDSSSDDEQAQKMLQLLPVAYLWTITGEKGDLVTLSFKPDPSFNPPDMEARVLGAMAGEIVVARSQMRIRTIKGTLTQDVKFGFGIFGRLRSGGFFQVERREVVPHHWQVTESHVHLIGKALFFKSIGSEEDDTKYDFHISPCETLQQAAELMPTLK